MKKITMYEVTHKDRIYIPKDRKAIFVGHGLNESNYLRDNTGDNIAEKNENYCELTALYWIWKNDSESENVSIEHYRRFFMNPVFPRICSSKKILNYLQQYDVVATRLYTFRETVRSYYAEKHVHSDLDIIGQIIDGKCPEYLDAYDKVINGTTSCMCNMAAMKKELFDRYCEWLFGILFELEKMIDISERDAYQKRVYGFLSERLFNVWLEKNNLKVKHVPIYYLEDTKIVSVLKSAKHMKEWSIL